MKAAAKKKKFRKKKVGEEEQKKKARRGMFAHAHSDDETDFDEAPARIHKVQSPNKPGQTGIIGVIKKAQIATRNVRQAEEENQDSGVDANDDSASLWVPFQTADGKSLFFSSRSDVQRRMLARWINKASQRMFGSFVS